MLLTAMLAVGSLCAQPKHVVITVQTFENATLTSARICAATLGADYFADSAHLSGLYGGAAARFDTLPVYSDLVRSADGSGFAGKVDSATFATSFIMVKDAHGHYYALGDVSSRDLGIVRPAHLFDGIATGDTLDNGRLPMTVGLHMLMPPTPVLRDNHQTLYASLAAGIADAQADSLFFLAPLTVGERVAISRNVVISQGGHTLTNMCGGDMVDISGATVYWTGATSAITTPSASSGYLFSLHSGVLLLSGTHATSAAGVARLEGRSAIVASASILATTNPGVAVVVIRDEGSVMADGVVFTGGLHGVSIVEGSTGKFVTTENTVTSDMASYAVPVNAYAYSKAGNLRTYRRTIKLAAADADTVYLARTMAAGMDDTIANPTVLELAGNQLLGGLYVIHSEGQVVVEGGVVGSIIGSASSAAALVLQGLDSVGSVQPADHATTINSGRYVALTPDSGAPITLTGGKFTRTYPSYLAPNHTFIDNPDAADKAIYPKQVVAGHQVLYVNYDCLHHDTTIVYNEPDGRIRPLLDSPRYPGTDTVFIAWHTDSLFTNIWNATDDELTQDTTLYAQWHVVDTTAEYRYLLRHHLIGLAGDTTVRDSAMMIAPKNSLAQLTVNHYLGRHCTDPGNPPTALITRDSMVVDLYYALNKYALTWDARGGVFASGDSTLTDSLFYTQIVTLPAAPTRKGHTFTGWIDAPYTMQPINTRVYAGYQVNPRNVVWHGSDSTAAYTAAPITRISASYKDDDSNSINANIVFINSHNDTNIYALNAGRYTVLAIPLDTNYHLLNPTTTLTITTAPASVNLANLSFNTSKVNDGTTNVQLTDNGALTGILGSDNVTLNATAHYNDAQTGTGKTITAQFSLVGTAATNYTLSPTSAVLTTAGSIVDSIALDRATADNGISLQAFGYCTGSDTIHYYLQSGTPDQYSITFSPDAIANQHFVNTGWIALNPATPGILLVDIPATAESGDYTATLRFRDSQFPNNESYPISVTLHVNLPRTYTMPLFSDVIALVDTCQCFTDIQWYHNGVAIPGANLHYYQEAGGLTGEYHVTARMNGIATATCRQDDMATLLSNDSDLQPAVSTYPNPTTDQVSIRIEGSQMPIHTIQVMSIMGLPILNTTFEGNTASINLEGYQAGHYIVSIDGITTRIIKQ